MLGLDGIDHDEAADGQFASFVCDTGENLDVDVQEFNVKCRALEVASNPLPYKWLSFDWADAADRLLQHRGVWGTDSRLASPFSDPKRSRSLRRRRTVESPICSSRPPHSLWV